MKIILRGFAVLFVLAALWQIILAVSNSEYDWKLGGPFLGWLFLASVTHFLCMLAEKLDVLLEEVREMRFQLLHIERDI